MDILNILDQLKQKGLDVVQVELLKNAYELQNRNLEQLKANNDALRESNDLLKEKVERLDKQNQELVKQLKSLPRIQVNDGISDIAKDVLKECIKADVTEFNDEAIISSLHKYTRMQVETAIGELTKKYYIVQASVMSGYGEGVEYRLTQSGKEFALSLYEKK